MGYEFTALVYQKEGGVATVTMNRPEALNALSTQMFNDLYQLWQEIEQDDEVRVGILTGAGRAFCSGLDLKEASSGGGPPEARLGNYIPDKVTKPLIAAVNGAAAGGGLGLVLACDVAICSEEAIFVAPYAARGLSDPQSLTLLVKKVPPVWAMWMALSAERMDAQTALRIGIVKEVLPRDELMPRSLEMAERLLANSQESLRAIKGKMWASLNSTINEAMAQTGPLEEALRKSAAREEGLAAFSEKRRPRF